MSRPKGRFRKIDLDTKLIEEIENFLHEYPEARHENVADFIKEAAVLHIQELKKKYTRIQMDALSFLQELVTKS